jgi:hypothetical protein
MMTPDPTPRRAQRRPLREEEPFATMLAFPRRFGVGVPAVFLVAIFGGSMVANLWNLSAGVALLLIIQTAGLLGLYMPALRKRRVMDDDRARSGTPS